MGGAEREIHRVNVLQDLREVGESEREVQRVSEESLIGPQTVGGSEREVERVSEGESYRTLYGRGVRQGSSENE